MVLVNEAAENLFNKKNGEKIGFPTHKTNRAQSTMATLPHRNRTVALAAYKVFTRKICSQEAMPSQHQRRQMPQLLIVSDHPINSMFFVHALKSTPESGAP